MKNPKYKIFYTDKGPGEPFPMNFKCLLRALEYACKLERLTGRSISVEEVA